MDERQFDYINVIPLVDIMLVLLTIVLTTSTLVATGTIPLQLPRASSNKDALQKTQTIEIDKRGALFLNAAPVDLAALDAKLAAVDKSAPILIRADKTLALQSFVDVLDIVKRNAFSSVGLQTESAQ